MASVSLLNLKIVHSKNYTKSLKSKDASIWSRLLSCGKLLGIRVNIQFNFTHFYMQTKIYYWLFAIGCFSLYSISMFEN